jgi:hypothetical protein
MDETHREHRRGAEYIEVRVRQGEAEENRGGDREKTGKIRNGGHRGKILASA